MKSTRITLIAFLIILFITATGYAKDLKGRLGIGFNSQLTARSVNSISMKYWLSSNLGFQGTFGFVSSDDYDELDLGGKVLFKIQDEKNLHVDAFGGLGFVNYDPEIGDNHTIWVLGVTDVGFNHDIDSIWQRRGYKVQAMSDSCDNIVTCSNHRDSTQI